MLRRSYGFRFPLGQDVEAALKQRKERGERPATGSACLLPPPLRHDLAAAEVELGL